MQARGCLGGARPQSNPVQGLRLRGGGEAASCVAGCDQVDGPPVVSPRRGHTARPGPDPRHIPGGPGKPRGPRCRGHPPPTRKRPGWRGGRDWPSSAPCDTARSPSSSAAAANQSLQAPGCRRGSGHRGREVGVSTALVVGAQGGPRAASPGYFYCDDHPGGAVTPSLLTDKGMRLRGAQTLTEVTQLSFEARM